MRLRRFEITNFKAIQKASIDWEDLLVVIGENNSGKSCLLQALSLFLSGTAIKAESLFHNYATGLDHAIELVGYFDKLTNRDKNEVAVKGRMNGEEWVLKKRYWYENSGGEEKGVWKEQLYSYSSEEVFRDWPVPDTTWNAFPEDYQPFIEQIDDGGTRPSAQSREALKEIVRQSRPEWITMATPAWAENPGGGGNWKSNANSILPHAIYVRAVHEASDESISKDASTFGKLMNLIVEGKLSKRQEIKDLTEKFNKVMELFRPDAAHPERQAKEIHDLQERISSGLNSVIDGKALIKTQPVELRSLLLPSTSLVIQDPKTNIETHVRDQGHGLQRTLVMTLLQVLAETLIADAHDGGPDHQPRPTILIVEEPELYMHPQMERRMRDAIYSLAGRENFQVACSTHSPVFLDIADRYKSIVRMVRDNLGKVTSYQVTEDLFPGQGNQAEKSRLQTVARFNPAVNELFFSNQIVLFEEFTAIAAFERAADLTGVFARHPGSRREVTSVDCAGKANIPAFARILNAFRIPYRVVHDEDRDNPGEQAHNVRIGTAAAAAVPPAQVHLLRPHNLEGVLGYQAAKSSSKPYAAVKCVEDLHQNTNLPQEFVAAMNFVYFGTTVEPHL